MPINRALFSYASFSAALLAVGGCNHSAPVTTQSTIAPSQTTSDAPKPGGLSKLQIQDIEVGKGDGFKGSDTPVKNGDTLFVLYRGTLKDGTVFDSNMEDKAKAAFKLTLGAGDVIQGWDKGLVGMRIGGERKLSIPASMGYGSKAQDKIPANSDLYFNVRLVDAVKAGEENTIYKKDEKIGAGAPARPHAKLTIHYTVWDPRGLVLDSDDGRGLTFGLEDDQIYPQIEQGIEADPIMRVGGKRLLHLGPTAAVPGRALTPGSTEKIEIELVNIQ